MRRTLRDKGGLVRLALSAVVAVALAAMLVSDVWISSARHWWSSHSAVTSVTSSLLVVAVGAVIVDALIARRRQHDRATSVAVQATIVYEQVQRAYVAIMDPVPDLAAGLDEVRALSAMLLSASTVLFEDPAARPFLEGVQRLTGLMFRVATEAPAESGVGREELTSEMAQVKNDSAVLLKRLSTPYQAPFTEEP